MIRFKEHIFDYQFLRNISHGTYEGAAVGECYAVMKDITKPGIDLWYEKWRDLGQRVYMLGEAAAHENQVVGARQAFLRACNYFRSAEFFLPPTDPRKSEVYQLSRRSFQAALSFFPNPVEVVSFKYENTQLPGYFLKAKRDSGPVPTLVCLGGFDSIGEEVYFFMGAAALQQGYNVLIFEGPGQGAPLRLQGLPSRADYEVPVNAALDYVCARKDVDVNNIILTGTSFGGYYAPRACALDARHRIKACVVHGALFDFWDSQLLRRPILNTIRKIKPKSLLNSLIRLKMKYDLEFRWDVLQAMWVFGQETPVDVLKVMPQFSLKSVVHQIKCPVLILHGEGDHMVPVSQAKVMFDALQCPKTLRIFTQPEGAAQHCNFENYSLLHQEIFAWIRSVVEGNGQVKGR